MLTDFYKTGGPWMTVYWSGCKGPLAAEADHSHLKITKRASIQATKSGLNAVQPDITPVLLQERCGLYKQVDKPSHNVCSTLIDCPTSESVLLTLLSVVSIAGRARTSTTNTTLAIDIQGLPQPCVWCSKNVARLQVKASDVSSEGH